MSPSARATSRSAAFWTAFQVFAMLAVISACSADVESRLAEDEEAVSLEEGADGVPIVINRVVDGDSLEATFGDIEIELRLEGYNAPELYADGAEGETDRLTCNGTAAKDGLALMVNDAETTMLVSTDTDRFGRTLGDVVLDGRSAVDELIAMGFGLATGDSMQRRELMWAAAEANVGIWGDQCRSSAIDLNIGNVQNDPAGNDRFNLADEWVEVVNDENTPQDLSGWVLRDDTTGHRFGLAGELDPGEKLMVRTGGDPADSDVEGRDPTIYLGESFPVWSNNGETVILTDPDGAFIDWRFIEPS